MQELFNVDIEQSENELEGLTASELTGFLGEIELFQNAYEKLMILLNSKPGEL